MIDMFDLPTENELLQQAAMLESSKKAGKSADLDTSTFFPFYSPKGPQSAVKLSDKTGVVKPKVTEEQVQVQYNPQNKDCDSNEWC